MGEAVVRPRNGSPAASQPAQWMPISFRVQPLLGKARVSSSPPVSKLKPRKGSRMTLGPPAWTCLQ